MLKIFLAGATGNVGKAVVRAIRGKNGFELVGGWCLEDGVDIGVAAGIGEIGIIGTSDLERGLDETKPDMVIDFSATSVIRRNIKIYIERSLNAVVGTTGLMEDYISEVKRAIKTHGLRWSIISNYGLGISLLLQFLEKVRLYYPYASILDQHTQNMENAPSGTAVDLGRMLSKTATGDRKSREIYQRALGANIGGVQILSQRLPWPSAYSSHTVTLARDNEIIKMTVEDYTSDVYVDGIFLTASKLATAKPGTLYRSLNEILA